MITITFSDRRIEEINTNDFNLSYMMRLTDALCRESSASFIIDCKCNGITQYWTPMGLQSVPHEFNRCYE